jgi:periplasmic divalent cation tolerance protein
MSNPNEHLEDALVVITTTENSTAGERLAAALVERELAACVQVIPQMTSVYRWQGKVETSAEALLLIKTTQGNFAALSEAIKNLHSYQTPEIVALSVQHVSTDYLTWLRASVKKLP